MDKLIYHPPRYRYNETITDSLLPYYTCRRDIAMLKFFISLVSVGYGDLVGIVKVTVSRRYHTRYTLSEICVVETRYFDTGGI